MLELLLQEDLQLTNKWYCYFSGLSKSQFLVKNVNIPLEKLTTETKKYGEKYYNGFVPVETITITFFETTAFEVYAFFKDWMDAIFDSETKTFKVLSSDSIKYKSATVRYYRSTATSEKKSRDFQFKKLMILGMDELNLDQETSVPLEWSVQLAVEDVT